MKRPLLIFGLFLFVASAVSAQIPDYPALLQQLDLTQEQRERIMELRRQEARIRQEVQVELRLIKAKMEKLLLNKNVNIGEVENLLRSSLEWRYKMEMAQIRNRIEIRNLLGDEKYERLLLLMNRYRNQDQKQPRPRDRDSKRDSGGSSPSDDQQNQSRGNSSPNH